MTYLSSSKHGAEPTEKFSPAELVKKVNDFEGPPGEFLAMLLKMQCAVSGASAGAVLRASTAGAVDVLGIYPKIKLENPPAWLTLAVDKFAEIIDEGKSVTIPIVGNDQYYQPTANQYLYILPVANKQGAATLAAYHINTELINLAAAIEKIELTIFLISIYEMRQASKLVTKDVDRLRTTMGTVALISEHEKTAGVAMTLCNELASSWNADRVSIGVLRGRHIKLIGMSSTENFSRKMKIVQLIEATQEETFDQDIEVVYPGVEGTHSVNRQAGELSLFDKSTTVLSLPLRIKGEPVGVLTLERPKDVGFAEHEIETLRLICDLSSPWVMKVYEHDRWFGAKIARSTKNVLKWFLGAKNTWAKLIGISIFLFILGTFIFHGQFCAEGSFKLEAIKQHAISAPYDGFLAKVYVLPDQQVIKGETILAELDTSDMHVKKAALLAEMHSFQKKADAANSKGKIAEFQIATADANRIAEKIKLLDLQIKKAKLIAPMTGQVASNDLTTQIGRAVKTGDVLFEIAKRNSFYADIFVPEDEIAELNSKYSEGLVIKGELAIVGKPSEKIEFSVQRINPVAEVVEQKNVFRVRVKLHDIKPWMKIKLEGIAKIHLGKRAYAWLWTRKLINWVRMKMWW